MNKPDVFFTVGEIMGTVKCYERKVLRAKVALMYIREILDKFEDESLKYREEIERNIKNDRAKI